MELSHGYGSEKGRTSDCCWVLGSDKACGADATRALALTSILEEVGVPRGVINVVTTSQPAETMAPLSQDSRLRKLSFTGSTEVGGFLAERRGI